jgi:hypothetical protein
MTFCGRKTQREVNQSVETVTQTAASELLSDDRSQGEIRAQYLGIDHRNRHEDEEIFTG